MQSKAKTNLLEKIDNILTVAFPFEILLFQLHVVLSM